MKILFLFFLIFFSFNSQAQHQHNMPGMSDSSMKKMTVKKTTTRKTPAKKNIRMNMRGNKKQVMGDTTKPDMKMNMSKNMPMDQMNDTMMHGMNMGHMNMNMTHSYSRSLPMNRDGSGTSWMPDATPMYGYMKMTKKWNLMFHGSIFFRYNYQDITNKGVRSDSLTDRFDAPNWVMLMATRKVNKRGLFSFSFMLSADELTMGGNGYPLLFQSGETYNNKPLVDRQHPHDFISGLSVAYTHMFNKDIDLTAYLGYPGEPAIGPPVFMHRISSINNPDAPLGHHWQDATHITFGVATLGLRYKIVKFEFSNFTGREPDENRYNFDKPRFNSWAYRFSVNPTDNFAIQFSQAFIKNPEALEPEENITRTTASVLHSIILGEKTHLTSAAIWGVNQIWKSRPEHSVLLESNLQKNKTAFYGRYELIQKSADELKILPDDPDDLFLINKLTLGTSYNFLHLFKTNLRIGIQGSASLTSSKLHALYGKFPLSAEIYLHLLPINMNALGAMKHSASQNHSNH